MVVVVAAVVLAPGVGAFQPVEFQRDLTPAGVGLGVLQIAQPRGTELFH
jgi:hypothetical protein